LLRFRQLSASRAIKSALLSRRRSQRRDASARRQNFSPPSTMSDARQGRGELVVKACGERIEIEHRDAFAPSAADACEDGPGVGEFTSSPMGFTDWIRSRPASTGGLRTPARRARHEQPPSAQLGRERGYVRHRAGADEVRVKQQRVCRGGHGQPAAQQPRLQGIERNSSASHAIKPRRIAAPIRRHGEELARCLDQERRPVRVTISASPNTM